MHESLNNYKSNMNTQKPLGVQKHCIELSQSAKREFLKKSGAVTLLSLTSCAFAQTNTTNGYPNRFIKLILPGGAGGPFDVLARLAVLPIEKTLGQPIIPDYRSGAGGNIGMAVGARSPADGYNLVIGALAQLVLNPLVDSKVPYDVDRDFVPITLLALLPYVLVVHPSVPARNANELLALIRANPDKFNYASHGIGTTSHVAAELFKKIFNIKISHVPYKSAAQATTDMIGGQVQIMFDGVQSVAKHVESDRLRAIAMPSRARVALMSAVPTFEEQGLHQLIAESWFALIAPVGIPAPIVKLLNEEVNAVLQKSETIKGLANLGMVPSGNSSADLRTYIEVEKDKWRPIVLASGANSN